MQDFVSGQQSGQFVLSFMTRDSVLGAAGVIQDLAEPCMITCAL